MAARYFEADQDTYRERLIKTLALVENDIKHWNQCHFSIEDECGTCFCFAGMAAAHAFKTTKKADLEKVIRSNYNAGEWAGAEAFQAFTMDYFGLTAAEIYTLIWPDNTIEDLREIAGMLISRRSSQQNISIDSNRSHHDFAFAE